MEIVSTDIEDVLLIKPDVYEDNRGFFLETYRKQWLGRQGLDVEFVQDNLSRSQQDTIRGLHYQVGQEQAKLIMVPVGEIRDIAVDLRKDSPTFGNHVSTLLSGRNKYLLYVPRGFAHGFSVLSEEALVYYKCDNYYDRESERGIRWNDPELGIDWNVENPVLSEKDRQQPLLNEIPEEDLF